MKKIVLILFTISMILTNITKAQDVLSIVGELKLDGVKSEYNMFYISIVDDEYNEVSFFAKESFSFDLNLNHSYNITISSSDHISRFIFIDTHSVNKKLKYKIKSNLVKFQKNDTIHVDTIRCSKLRNKFFMYK